MENEILHYDVEGAILAQKKLCADKGLPHFAPQNGICWNCKGQIYGAGGITLEKAHKLVTGCPHCGRSYCN